MSLPGLPRRSSYPGPGWFNTSICFGSGAPSRKEYHLDTIEGFFRLRMRNRESAKSRPKNFLQARSDILPVRPATPYMSPEFLYPTPQGHCRKFNLT